tara:strand:+ start:2137 stop:2670 length:534 start_codon:yes stop_codon:yes gene_type:complete
MNKGALALKRYWKENGWQPDEIKYLRDNYKEKSDLEMSKKGLLKGRSYRTIADKRYRLNLKKERKNIKLWTNEEESLLKKHWREFDQNELHNKFLPNKTPLQIRSKKMDMGLKGKKYIWSGEEIETLLQVGATNTASFISQHYIPTKTSNQIRNARKFYGVKYEHIKRSKQKKCTLN